MEIFKKWFSKKENKNRAGRKPKEENTAEEECPNKVKMTLVYDQTFPYWHIGDKPDVAKCTNFMHVDEISLHVFDNCLFTNTCFDSSVINGAVFVNCKFKNVSFYNMRLAACRFDKCVFDSADAGIGTDSRFVSCMFQMTRFSECEFLRIKFDSVFAGSRMAPLDLRNCKFGRVLIVDSNIENIMFPPGEELRYGKILKESMIGWKTAIPILDEQYEKIKDEESPCIPADFIDEHGLNREIGHPFIISTEDIYNMYLAFVELVIPEGAVVFTTDNMNFRTNKAVVKNIYRKAVVPCEDVEFPTFETNQAVSKFDNKTMYVVGKTLEVEDFPLNPTKTDCPGIYFCTGDSQVSRMFYDGLKWKENQEKE